MSRSSLCLNPIPELVALASAIPCSCVLINPALIVLGREWVPEAMLRRTPTTEFHL